MNPAYVFLKIMIMVGLIPAISFSQSLSMWGYRMPIAINNPNASSLTNFQVKLSINTAALVGAGQMQANGNDIRFTDANCNNIDYYIENGINTTTTSIWVKVPALAASDNTTIYMYFGNNTATATSDGDKVFLFFDDFEDGVFNTTKWTTRGTPSTLNESSGILTLIGNNNWEYIRSNTTWTGPVVIEDVEKAAGSSAAMVLGYENTDNRFSFRANNPSKATTYDDDVSGGNQWFNQAYPNIPHPFSDFNEFQLKTDLVNNTIVVNSFCNKTTSNCNTTPTQLNTFTGNGYYIGFTSYSTGYTLYVDWVRVRNFAAIEPTSTTGTVNSNGCNSKLRSLISQNVSN